MARGIGLVHMFEGQAYSSGSHLSAWQCHCAVTSRRASNLDYQGHVRVSLPFGYVVVDAILPSSWPLLSHISSCGGLCGPPHTTTTFRAMVVDSRYAERSGLWGCIPRVPGQIVGIRMIDWVLQIPIGALNRKVMHRHQLS